MKAGESLPPSSGIGDTGEKWLAGGPGVRRPWTSGRLGAYAETAETGVVPRGGGGRSDSLESPLERDRWLIPVLGRCIGSNGYVPGGAR